MRRLPVLLLVLLLTVVTGASAAQGTTASAPSGPIDVTSDRMEADNAARQIRFLGQVVAKQGDVTLYAREMRVFLQEKVEEIERLEAVGEVRIVQGEKVATAEKGIFYNREGRIVLTGSPKVHQGTDFVSGDEIILYLQEERSVVRSSEGSRVKAVFHSKDGSR